MIKIIEFDELSGLHIAQCECGILFKKKLSVLKKLKFCLACRQSKRLLDPKILISNRVYQTYYRSAKLRKIKFRLSKPELRALIFLPCFFCKQAPASTQKGFRDNYYNGIDRLDSSKGYELENCVSCCWACNNMKGTLSVDDFIKQCKLIVANYS